MDNEKKTKIKLSKLATMLRNAFPFMGYEKFSGILITLRSIRRQRLRELCLGVN